MHNEFPLPYFLQQHEITKKTTYELFSNPKSGRIATNDYESIPYGWIIDTIK